MTESGDYLEGDYIRTHEGLYFAVKGSRHPKEKVIAYLRYRPNVKGDREKDGVKYTRMYSIEKTTKFLKEKYPKYLNKISWLDDELQSVPLEDIDTVFKPTPRLKEIIETPKTSLDCKVKRFVETLSKKSSVPIEFFGVSGSLLIGLNNPDSDIDINVYGYSEGRKVYETLKELRERLDWIHPYNPDTVQNVLRSRWGDTGLNLKKFVKTEINKTLHGLVEDTDYFIRLIITEPNSSKVTQRGESRIRGIISDSTNAIFTPCSYFIETMEILGNYKKFQIIELKSYRGKFTEQSVKEDYVEAKGQVEEVDTGRGKFFRLMLEDKDDYLLPVEEFL